jgi:hypothetical protein
MIGRRKASQSWKKRAALSAESASMAPPRWNGSFAISPNGWPSIRRSDVTMLFPNSRRSSSADPASAIVSMIGRIL